jgi:hypothetical protein
MNFLFPGAGVAYLGLWIWAIVNLVGGLALVVGLVLYAPASQLSWLEIVVPVANGVIAQAIAQSRNVKLRLRQGQPKSTEANPYSVRGESGRRILTRSPEDSNAR